MGVSFELIFDGFGLDNPLIGAISVFMNELCGFIAIYRVNLIFCVVDIGAVNLKALDKHDLSRNNQIVGEGNDQTIVIPPLSL